MDCIFCSIASRAIPSEFIYESKHVFVIKDIHPKAKVHLLVIPKEHLATLSDVTPEQADCLSELLLAIAAVVRKVGIADTGYKVVSNNGRDGGQEVPHLHWHVLGGQPLRGLV